MANYYGTVRTNLFRVTDEDKYNEIFGRLSAEDTIHDLTKVDENGNIFHGFGSYSIIDYIVEEDEEDTSGGIDGFITELQKILPDDEVFVYEEVGNEKLCYLVGLVVVATKDTVKSNELAYVAKNLAKEMVGKEVDIKLP